MASPGLPNLARFSSSAPCSSSPLPVPRPPLLSVFTRQGMCRDKGASSTSTLLTSGGAGGASKAARYIFITYSEDWTNWVGAEEICRNQGYGLASIDSDSEPIIAAMMQAAGVNQIWTANGGANPVLVTTIFSHAGDCGFTGRRFVNGAWALNTDLRTPCSTPMGYICDTQTKATGLSPTVTAVLVVGGVVLALLLLCCLFQCRKRISDCVDNLRSK